MNLRVFQMEPVLACWRTTMSGVTSMANGLSWVITAFAGGYVIAGLGYRTLFLAGAALSVAGVLFFWARFCVPRGDVVCAADGA